MPSEIEKLADSMLTNPEKIEVTPVSSTVDTIRQSVYFVEKKEKKDLLLHLLKNPEIESVLIFTRTKHGADKLARILNKSEIGAEAIHGNKSQNARQRALTNFKDHTTRVLIATDIAARGIDVNQLSHVINYELPNISETYVHRIGRTGRAGHDGIVALFKGYPKTDRTTDSCCERPSLGDRGRGKSAGRQDRRTERKSKSQ